MVASFAAGGYLAGRLRTPWASSELVESQFRDGAHGFGAWALAVLLGAALAVAGVGGALKDGGPGHDDRRRRGHSGCSLQSGGRRCGRSLGNDTDRLRRRPAAAPAAGIAAGEPGNRAQRSDLAAPIARAFAANLHNPQLDARDRASLVQLVVQQTGMPQADAEKRVDRCLHRVEAGQAEGARCRREGTQSRPDLGVRRCGDPGDRMRRRLCRSSSRRAPPERKDIGRALRITSLLVRLGMARQGCRAFSCQTRR